jgi:ribonuclease Z
MSTREVTILGTASQVPTRSRNHNAAILLWDDLGILFDPGEGTQRQMTLAGVSVSQITHIAVTHFHGDHCLGLAGIIQRLSLDGIVRPVEVIYPASGQVFFERLRHASIFYDRTTLVPRPISGDGLIEATRSGTVSLQACPLEHGVDCYGYRLQEADGRRMLPDKLSAAGVRGPAVGELMRQGEIVVSGQAVRLEDVSELRPGQSFALVMDTRPCAGARTLAQGVDMLVCESTYLESEHEEAHDHFHMTARQAAELAREAGARRLVLTHFSQRYDDREQFLTEASAAYADVFAAGDLMRIPVPKRRET